MKNDIESIKEKIIRTLKQHPEGLTIVEIAKKLGMHRLTATKYVYALVGAGIVYQRIVGPAKICYLKKSVMR